MLPALGKSVSHHPTSKVRDSKGSDITSTESWAHFRSLAHSQFRVEIKSNIMERKSFRKEKAECNLATLQNTGCQFKNRLTNTHFKRRGRKRLNPCGGPETRFKCPGSNHSCWKLLHPRPTHNKFHLIGSPTSVKMILITLSTFIAAFS